MRKIFGHRGLPRIYPENTLSSINKAFEYCDFVETDIRITKDNQLILFHDPNIGDDLIKDFNYKPSTSVDEGIKKFVKWYKFYYKV